MCKVFGMAGLTDKNRGDAIKLLKEVSKKMVVFEKDGFGYAAIDESGEVYGEKWLRPKDVFSKRIKRKIKPAREVIPRLDKPVLKTFDGLLEGYKSILQKPAPPIYDNFGKGELGKACAVIAHSRHSTGASTSIENVHPFVNYETALVHNGIVWNEDNPLFYKEVSDCDSEIILNQYNQELVQMDSRRIQETVDPLDAYFACLVLTNAMDKDENMLPVMDIFKADANLEIVYIHDLDLFTFCTEGSIVVDICKSEDFGYSTSRPIKVTDNFLIRINAITGEIVETEYFDYSRKNTNYNDNYLQSRYGANWKDYATGEDIPEHKEYYKDKDKDNRSAEDSAKTFIEKSGEIVETRGGFWGPYDMANEVIVEEEEREKLESKYSGHRDLGTRHAK